MCSCRDSRGGASEKHALHATAVRVRTDKNAVGSPTFGFFDEDLFRAPRADVKTGLDSRSAELHDRRVGESFDPRPRQHTQLIDRVNLRLNKIADRSRSERVCSCYQFDLRPFVPRSSGDLVDCRRGPARAVESNHQSAGSRVDLVFAACDTHRAVCFRQHLLRDAAEKEPADR